MEGHETSESMTSFVKSEAFVFHAQVLSISLCCLMKYWSKGDYHTLKYLVSRPTGEQEVFKGPGMSALKFVGRVTLSSATGEVRI